MKPDFNVYRINYMSCKKPNLYLTIDQITIGKQAILEDNFRGLPKSFQEDTGTA
jgi:hypothetical protein